MSSKVLKLWIHTEGDSFQPDPVSELQRILREWAKRLDGVVSDGHYMTIFDVNGNDVGRIGYKEGAE